MDSLFAPPSPPLLSAGPELSEADWYMFTYKVSETSRDCPCKTVTALPPAGCLVFRARGGPCKQALQHPVLMPCGGGAQPGVIAPAMYVRGQALQESAGPSR